MTTPSPEGRPNQSISIPARLPVPGNAEFLLWLCVEIVIAIVWAASDAVGAHDFVVATTWLSSAYVISRGIAKASRVFEH